MSNDRFTSFKTIVHRFYQKHGRKLPWRETTDLYQILVSELMLQQTQVHRVLPKYKQFIEAFPDFRSLARAKTAEVIRVWQGLGYNRRALYLKRTAIEIVEKFEGRLPSDPEILKTFPGIGTNTAGSLMAFAFNTPVAFIETNIRTVFIHHFFPNKEKITDEEILPLLENTLDLQNPRTWYWALMDYGSYLKGRHPNPSRKSAHYAKQSPFMASNRRVRGLILKRLTQKTSQPITELVHELHLDKHIIMKNVLQLEKEGFIKTTDSLISLS